MVVLQKFINYQIQQLNHPEQIHHSQINIEIMKDDQVIEKIVEKLSIQCCNNRRKLRQWMMRSRLQPIVKKLLRDSDYRDSMVDGEISKIKYLIESPSSLELQTGVIDQKILLETHRSFHPTVSCQVSHPNCHDYAKEKYVYEQLFQQYQRKKRNLPIYSSDKVKANLSFVNEFMERLRESLIKQIPSTDCAENCEVFHQGLTFAPETKNVILISQQDEKSSISFQSWTLLESILGLANIGGGSIFMGIHDTIIKGVELSTHKIDIFVKSLDYETEETIQPGLKSGSLHIGVNFFPVISNSSIHSQQNTNKCIIKLKVTTNIKNRFFFIARKTQENNYIYRFPVKDKDGGFTISSICQNYSIEMKNAYSNIQKAYFNKAQENVEDPNTKMYEKQKYKPQSCLLKQVNHGYQYGNPLNDIGLRPEILPEHNFTLIILKRVISIQDVEDLRSINKQNFLCYEIFENLKKGENNNHRFYWINHMRSNKSFKKMLIDKFQACKMQKNIKVMQITNVLFITQGKIDNEIERLLHDICTQENCTIVLRRMKDYQSITEYLFFQGRNYVRESVFTLAQLYHRNLRSVYRKPDTITTNQAIYFTPESK